MPDKGNETKSQEYLESIIDTVREPLIALDQDLRVVSVSRSFYEVFRVKPIETIGQLIYDLGNKQWNIPKLRELLETILPKKATFDNYEVEHNFAGIGRRIMLLNARQIQRVLGKERIILLSIEDITARREIENGLEKARKELEATKISEDAAREYAESIINTVREPLIALDQDLRVVSVSRSFYEVFKVKPEETVGQLIYNLGNKQWNIPKLRELLETILPKKATFDNYVVEHDFATIGRRIMLLNARQIQRVLGKKRIILLAIEDITERKKVEEELKKLYGEMETKVQQRTAELLASKHLADIGTLAATVAHELRNPLGVINVAVYNLRKKLKGRRDIKKHLFNIEKKVSESGQIINNLLVYSRMKLPQFEKTDIYKLLSECAVSMKKHFAGKKIRFKSGLKPIKGLLVDADQLQLKEIFTNIITNAFQAIETKKGVVEVKASVKAGKKVIISVKDTGVGISREDMGNIFKPFFTRKTKGTGLGLVICRDMVNMHNGSIDIKSSPGKGSTFTVTLPQRRS